MPVYNGGQMFKEAIHSVLPCLPWFSRVIISLNGKETHGDHAIALELADDCDLTILETEEILTSVQHLQFIVNHLNQKMLLAPDSQLFVLCHDDLLHRPGFERLDQEQWKAWRPDCISLGDYLVFREESWIASPRHECWFARYDTLTSRPKSAFLKTQHQRHDDPFTNLSGMRLSLAVLSSTIHYFSRTGSKTGMRLEYSLIVNRHIQEVINFEPPLVCIREHSGSVGARVTRRDFAASELRYAIWMWMNCESVSSLKQLLQGQYGFTGLLKLVQICLLHRYYEFLGWTRSWLIKGGVIAP
jgi:hypothetical protein